MLSDYSYLSQYSRDDRHHIISALYQHETNYEKKMKVTSLYRDTYITFKTIHQTDELLLHFLILHSKIIITTSLNNIIYSNDIIYILFGDYPLNFNNLCIDEKSNFRNVIYRHISLYDSFVYKNLIFYSHNPIWNCIDKIFIISLDEHYDRYIQTLRELSLLDIPLNKIERIQAVNNKINPTIGCTTSHLNVLKSCISHGYKNVLICEDDICFISNTNLILNSIQEFFDSNYVYGICFLSASYYGEIISHDKLLNRSKQICTTASCYMLNKSIYSDLERVWSDYLQSEACDRSWSRLQDEYNFFIFANKLAFQRITRSNITNEINNNLD